MEKDWDCTIGTYISADLLPFPNFIRSELKHWAFRDDELASR